MASKPGRPKADIDLTLIEELAAIGSTLEEMSAVLRVGKSTIKDRAAAEPEIGEAIERGRARGRTTLRRHQWQQAEAGNPTMLVWLGKQLLGQRDVTSVARAIKLPLPAIETPDDVLKAVTAVVDTMARGDITPDEAAIVAGVIEVKRKAIETVDIERRLAAVEADTFGK